MHQLILQRPSRVIGVLSGLVLVVAVVAWQLGGSSTKADQIDEDLIKDTIKSGVELMGEACVASSHGQEQSFKDQVTQYYNSTPPAGATLTARQQRFQMLFATPDPSALATDIAEAGSAGTSIPSDKATAIAGYTVPTPNWDPAHSPLQERWGEIDACQETYGLAGAQALGFGVDTYNYQSITINGNDATVSVNITMWSEYNPGSGVQRSTATYPWQFRLKKESGVWKIAHQYYDFMP